MHLPNLRHAMRVPLFTRVEAEGPVRLGHTYSWNISEGGVYLKAPEAHPLTIPKGTRLALSFSLPGTNASVRLNGEVAWADPDARDHHGRRSLGIGVKFDEGQPSDRDRIREFIKTFRYRVVVVGFADVEAIAEAIGQSFELVASSDGRELERALETSQVGLIVMHEGTDPLAGAVRLAHLLASSSVLLQPPIIYCGGALAPPEALVEQITRKGRVVYVPRGAHPLALTTLAQRLVESHILALENELLTGELERTLNQLRDENQSLRRRLVEPSGLPGMVGDSPPMQRLCQMVERVAPLETTVLIHGESGTGKELLARALHAKSPRADRAFVTQNCAALAESLLDDELFGHIRGAFTGAIANRAGLFESAEGGTVFLDEVGEMSGPMQAKLLRVLEDKEVRRIGAAKGARVDVRLICATHRDLLAMVKEGTFREDLYYRLRGFVLAIPPLRERKGDVQALAQHFVQVFGQRHQRAPGGFTPDAMRLLEEFDWPANVRELHHAVERLVILGEPERPIRAELVQETLGLVPVGSAGGGPPAGRSLDDAVAAYERQLIIAQLDRAGGVLAQAARTLGVDRTTLSKRCKRLGLTVKTGGEPGSPAQPQSEPERR
jgi:uncharacterized protein (TIGR02266 family)